MNKRLVSIVLMALLAIAAVGAVGVYEYRAGVARGLEMSGKLPFGPGGWAYPHWVGPFYPLGFIFPLLMVIMIFACARRLFWSGRSGGRGYWHPCGTADFRESHPKADEPRL